MRLIASLILCFFIVSDAEAQSSCNESCGSRNRSTALGVASSDRSALLTDSSCSLRLVLKSPTRGEEISFRAGTVERNFMGVTFTAPFNKISDLLVLNVALQNDALYPQLFARGAKDTVATMKVLEDDPRAGLRWSLVFRATPQSASEDRVSLRATWRNPSAPSGFSMTEVRLAPANFAVWCW